MSATENLNQHEAIKKLKTLAKDKSTLLTTFTDPYQIDARPMYTQGIDDDGTLWFFSKKDSNKNRQLASNSAISLMYANTGSDSYLFVEGTAKVMRDQAIIDRLWTDFAKVWFEEGKDDPSLTLIKVNPEHAHYWDTQHGKIISSAKILFSTLTGAAADDGREGELNV